MDRYDTDTLINAGPAKPKSPRIVERQFIEDSMALWEEALSTDLPDLETGQEPEPLFIGPEEPITAPLAEDRTVEPTQTESRDGFTPRPEEALRVALEEEVKSVLKTSVSVELPDRKSKRPARRVFWFDRPVSDGKSPSGTLFALGPSGGLVELQTGVEATRVIEVIDPDDGPTSSKTEALSAELQGGVVHWSRQDS